MEQEQSAWAGVGLLAIVAADVAGYSRLICPDEVGTALSASGPKQTSHSLSLMSVPGRKADVTTGPS